MIKEYRITEMLYEKCQKVTIKKNEWVCRCPLCGDSTTKSNVKRFHINYYPAYDTFMYKCHRCGESNNVYQLYSILYDTSYKEAKKFLNDSTFKSESIQKRLSTQKENCDTKLKTDLDINLKTDCYFIDDNPSSIIGKKLVKKLQSFINDRKISEKCFIAHTGRYKGRIIVPIINNNILEYFQGRSLYNNIEPKYLNPKIEKDNIILHRNVFDKNRDIIITEGIIDAMSIGNQSTCCLGSSISDEFLTQIMSYTNKGIIICLDNIFIDNAAKNQMLKLIKKSKYSKILKYFLMPKKYNHIKDINELKIKFNIENLENFVQLNSYSSFFIETKVKMKL